MALARDRSAASASRISENRSVPALQIVSMPNPETMPRLSAGPGRGVGAELHQHVGRRRDRHGAAAGGQQVPLGVGQEVAVHVVDVGAEQAVALEVGDGVAGAGHADVDRDRQPEVAGEGVVLRVAGGAGEGRPAQPHAHPQPPVAAGAEVLVAHPAGVGRVRRVRVVGGGAGAAVEEVAADPGVPQPAQVRVGVGRRLVVVRPVGDRGDPGVERLQGAPQGAGVDVVRRVLEARCRSAPRARTRPR